MGWSQGEGLLGWWGCWGDPKGRGCWGGGAAGVVGLLGMGWSQGEGLLRWSQGGGGGGGGGGGEGLLR